MKTSRITARHHITCDTVYAMNRALPSWLAVLLLSGCGGRSMSIAEIAQDLPEQDRHIARCQTEVLYESNLSDEGIGKLAEGMRRNPDDVLGELSAKDNLSFQRVMPDFINC